MFCQQYEQHHQRKGREGAFEIEFVNGQGKSAYWWTTLGGWNAETCILTLYW
ncbi:hypothetical protein IMZ48_25045, partial [Candidatus Bathyarchaeota archaeon]|nr:hypothetical protein [Candidatus Bathyarchaeota archaeon]